MHNADSQRRMLLLSANGELQSLFSDPALTGWECVWAENSGKASQLWQMQPCAVVLADDSHYRKEGLEGLHWLNYQVRCPILLAADVNARIVSEAFERGVTAWLPYRFVRAELRLLKHTMDQLAQSGGLQRQCEQMQQELEQCRQKVDRLVSLFSQSGAAALDKHWYSQRHMLQRLKEEMARCQRHGTPLTVALGEIHPKPTVSEVADNPDLIDWTARQISFVKRRSDVAGQYGLRTFMLLMPHTTSRGGVSCCRRLQHQLEAGQSQELEYPVRTYFGLVTFSAEAETPQRLLSQAEEHLEFAKRENRERIFADAR